MPWDVVKRGAEWCVVKRTDNTVEKCHATEAEANQHMAALYSSEAGGHAAAAGGCTCQHAEIDEITVEMLDGQIEVTDAHATLLAAAVEPLDSVFPTPAYPPSSWFDEPLDIEPGQKLTVYDDGRVAGYFYDKDSCLVHMHGACPKPSPTRYAAFHQNDVVLDDGTTMSVGVIGNTKGHADEYSSISSAQAHYANPDAQMIVCRAGDNDHGGWIAGALVPGLTYGDVALIRRSALSGDWRPMPVSWWRAHNIPRRAVTECEGYDCIGPTLVNRPGLPLVRQYARTAAALDRWLPDYASLDDEGVTVKVTIEGEPGPVTEVASALQAASPPPPPATTEEPPADAKGETELEARVVALEETVGQIVAMLQEAQQQQAASVAAAVKPVPPRADGQTVIGDFVDNEKIRVPA